MQPTEQKTNTEVASSKLLKCLNGCSVCSGVSIGIGGFQSSVFDFESEKET